MATPSTDTSVAPEHYFSDPFRIGDKLYCVGEDANLYGTHDNEPDSNPVPDYRYSPGRFLADQGISHGTEASAAAHEAFKQATEQAKGRYNARPYPCGRPARLEADSGKSGYTVIAGRAYCQRCAPVMMDRELAHSGHSAIGIFGTLSTDDKSVYRDTCCGDAIPMPKMPSDAWNPVHGLGGPNLSRLMPAVRKMQGTAYLPSTITRQQITAPYGLLGDAPVLGYGDSTRAKRPAAFKQPVVSKPKPVPAPATNEPDSTGVNWRYQYEIAVVTVKLLRSAVARLQGELERKGVPLSDEMQHEFEWLGFEHGRDTRTIELITA